MNKSLLNLLTGVTLTLGTRLHGMEVQSGTPNSKLLGLESYEPENIKQLNANRDAFESELKSNQKLDFEKKYVPSETLNLTYHIDEKHRKFIRYMYYAQCHDKPHVILMLSQRESATKLAAEYRVARVDGYSALGAILIAKEISHEYQNRILQRLFDSGFQPTEKDRELAYLELYERTPLDSTRKALLWLICSNNPKNTSGLPHLPLEVIKHIASFITEEKSLL